MSVPPLADVILKALSCHCPPPYDRCIHDDPRPDAERVTDAVCLYVAGALEAVGLARKVTPMSTAGTLALLSAALLGDDRG